MAQDIKRVYQLTEEGKKELESQLDYLKNTARKQNIIAIQDARSQGDLSENADYSAAREEQGRIEAEITRIEDILQHCKIISNKDVTDLVALGKRVRMIINGSEKEYAIVSTIEVDPRNGKISNESPLGSNLIGHRAGEVITFRTESDREVTVEILEVINSL
mgnify:FL=1